MDTYRHGYRQLSQPSANARHDNILHTCPSALPVPGPRLPCQLIPSWPACYTVHTYTAPIQRLSLVSHQYYNYLYYCCLVVGGRSSALIRVACACPCPVLALLELASFLKPRPGKRTMLPSQIRPPRGLAVHLSCQSTCSTRSDALQLYHVDMGVPSWPSCDSCGGMNHLQSCACSVDNQLFVDPDKRKLYNTFLRTEPERKKLQ